MVIDWLLEDDNPAVQYGARTELVGEKTEKSHVIDWVGAFLPEGWQDAQGL